MVNITRFDLAPYLGEKSTLIKTMIEPSCIVHRIAKEKGQRLASLAF